MKKFLFFFVLPFVSTCTIHACGSNTVPAYAGFISYSIDPSHPLQCTAVAIFDFDVVEALSNDSIWLNWGDGAGNYIYAKSIVPDSVSNMPLGYNRYYRHTYSGTHNYSQVGTYTLSVLNQFRVNYLTNVNGASNYSMPYAIQAQVVVDTIVGFINLPPTMAPPSAPSATRMASTIGTSAFTGI